MPCALKSQQITRLVDGLLVCALPGRGILVAHQWPPALIQSILFALGDHDEHAAHVFVDTCMRGGVAVTDGPKKQA